MNEPIDGFRKMSYNTTFDSPLIYSLATDAVVRCNNSGDFDTITSIILAFTSLECFLNEIYQAAETYKIETNATITDCESVFQLSECLNPGRENKRKTLEKYDCAWLLITGKRIDKANANRRSLRILEKIRNGIIHIKSETTQIGMTPDVKPQWFDGEYLGKAVELHEIPGFMNDLFGLHLIHKPSPESKWLLQICSQSVANWACECVRIAAFTMLDCAGDAFPLKQTLKGQSLAFYAAPRVPQ